jgi:hypothetical protein
MAVFARLAALRRMHMIEKLRMAARIVDIPRRVVAPLDHRLAEGRQNAAGHAGQHIADLADDLGRCPHLGDLGSVDPQSDRSALWPQHHPP